MSTLARTNSQNGKKPQYKDYMSFVDSYRGAKKDDQHSVVTSDSGVNFSLYSSANNSSNSVFSDVSDKPTGKFINKTSTLPPKQPAKHTVKTEMFIDINNPPGQHHSFPTQVFEVHRVSPPAEESTISVSSTAKMFENRDQIDSHISSKSKQNSFKKNSIGEISKKFESNEQTKTSTTKPPVKRAPSIGEVSKIFENSNPAPFSSTLKRKTKNFNSVPKPFLPPTPSQLNTTQIKFALPAKPAILSPKPVLNSSVPVFPKFIPDPPRSYADSVDSALSSLSVSPSPPQCASPPPCPMLPPPPPPPLPPANFSIKSSLSTQKPLKIETPKASNGYTPNQKIPVQTNEYATNGGTLDRNDPRVKKAVYGALRNMYGTYHDQANDYLATLPKNRVKKNNGLDSIINSIASQGGLEKLTGRGNPKQETD